MHKIEYAKSARSSCKGKCENPKIEKGELRFGSVAERDGHEMVYWKHLNCVTKKQLQAIESIPEIQGFSALKSEDQQQVTEILTRKITEEPLKKKNAAKPKKSAKTEPKEPTEEDELPKKRKNAAKPKTRVKKTKEAKVEPAGELEA